MRDNDGMGEDLHASQHSLLGGLHWKGFGQDMHSHLPQALWPLTVLHQGYSLWFLPAWTLQAFIPVNFARFIHTHGFDHHLDGNTSKLLQFVPFLIKCLTLPSKFLTLSALFSTNSSYLLIKLSLKGVSLSSFPSQKTGKHPSLTNNPSLTSISNQSLRSTNIIS